MAEGGRGEQGAPCVRTLESAAHKLHGFSPRSAGCENGEEGGDGVHTPLSASRSFASPYFSLAPNTGGEAWRQVGCDEGAARRCPDLRGSLPSLFLPPLPCPSQVVRWTRIENGSFHRQSSCKCVPVRQASPHIFLRRAPASASLGEGSGSGCSR
jgi:hypothetical protein